jgi:hypothetical protein
MPRQITLKSNGQAIGVNELLQKNHQSAQLFLQKNIDSKKGSTFYFKRFSRT